MTKRASTLTAGQRDMLRMKRAAERQHLKEAGLLGAPVQRSWKAKNAKAVASKRACRDYRREA